jgi:hypothetical protein
VHEQLKQVGSFHNEEFPGPNTGTFRKAEAYGWRIFLKSWVNLGIDWASPEPGEPCVMLNAMRRDNGRWVDSRWLKLAREHLKSGLPLGVVAAAANSTARDTKARNGSGIITWSDPAGGKGKKWFPLGRYIVRDVSSAPSGAFSRAPKAGRMRRWRPFGDTRSRVLIGTSRGLGCSPTPMQTT